jgi:hypothetical protein
MVIGNENDEGFRRDFRRIAEIWKIGVLIHRWTRIGLAF